MSIRATLCLLASLAPAYAQQAPNHKASPGLFYAVVHMANSEEIVEWALENGANGIEADLRFDSHGNPLEFNHGAPCDCSCRPGEICRRFGREVCNTSSAAGDFLSFLATQASLALVFVDSKIDESTPQQEAGTKAIIAIDDQLFAPGYPGKVVLSTKEFESEEFLKAAAAEVEKRDLASRVFLTFSGEGKVVEENLRRLIAFPTGSRAFGAGTSACWIGPYRSTIRLAEANRRSGVIGLTYIWTIDRRHSMKKCIDLGVGAIITNNPRGLSELLKERDIELAAPGSAITKGTNDVVLSRTTR
jgi:hypothetical protein